MLKEKYQLDLAAIYRAVRALEEAALESFVASYGKVKYSADLTVGDDDDFASTAETLEKPKSEDEIRALAEQKAARDAIARREFYARKKVWAETDAAERLVEAQSARQIAAEYESASSVSRTAMNIMDELRYRLQRRLGPNFATVVQDIMRERGISATELYARACLDRRLFYKIRRQNGYHPSKETVIAIGLGLRLTLPQMESLLRIAGFYLSESDMRDMTVRYFLEQGEYDIFTINEYLDYYGCPLLGNVKE